MSGIDKCPELDNCKRFRRLHVAAFRYFCKRMSFAKLDCK
jgi:hypothetical protein